MNDEELLASLPNKAPAQPMEQPSFDPLETLPNKPSQIIEAYKKSLEVDPEQAAKVIKYSQALGVSPSQVAENTAMAERVANAPSARYWAEYEAKNPGAMKHLNENPHLVAAAKDDLENISNTEKAFKEAGFWSNMYSASMSGLGSMYSSLARVPGLVYDAAALPQNLAVKAAGRPDLQVSSKQFGDAIGVSNKVADYYDKASQSYRVEGIDKSIVEEVRAGNYASAGKTLALQFAQNAPTQAALVMSALSGLGTAGLVGAGLSTAASSHKEGEDMGADPAMNTINSLTKGTVEAGFESLGTFGLIKKWEAALAKEVGKGGAKEVMKQVGKTLAHSALGEGNEEFATSVAQDFSDYITGVKPDALNGIWTRALDAGVVGAASGVAMTGPGAAHAGVSKGFAVRQQEKLKASYLAVGDEAAKSKLKQRLPEEHAKLLGTIAKDSPIETLFIPVEAAETYFQTKGIAIQQVVKDLGIETQYESAKKLGTNADLQIPLSKWVEKMGGTEHYNALANDIKFKPEDSTLNEIKAQQKQMETLFQEESAKADKLVKEDSAVKAGRQMIYDDISAQLTAAAPSLQNIPAKERKDWVHKNATIFANKTIIDAVKSGKTVEEYWAEKRPTIQTEDQANNLSKTPFRKDVLERIRSEVEAGDAQPGGIVQPSMQDPTNDIKFIPSTSTFPDYFQGKNLKKKEVLKAIDKALTGKELTQYEADVVHKLYRSSGYHKGFEKFDPFFQSQLRPVENASQIQDYLKEKGKQGSAVFVTDSTETGGQIAQFDPVTGHLNIAADKITSLHQVDSILTQFEKQKPHDLKGKQLETEIGKLKADETARALGRQMANLKALMKCVGGA